ncbi:MAG: c-type cytochrome, partial [Planctomycetales bacterium]|nr:c-type cytochrome [Planctomycetales bacterium]
MIHRFKKPFNGLTCVPAFVGALLVTTILVAAVHGDAELESQFARMNRKLLTARVELQGDAQRGARVFYRATAACSRCHVVGEGVTPLGPDLALLGAETTIDHLVESLLMPSAKIKTGYETVTITLNDGQVKTGIIAKQDDKNLVLRNATDLTHDEVISKSTVESIDTLTTSMMPTGLVATFRDERQVIDLLRFLQEVSQGGVERAAQLRPDPSELVVVDDTLDLDHAGIIRAWGEADFRQGKQIFDGHCINCHGADGNTPKLPTARAFGSQPFRFGADPYKMLITISRGAGLMAPLSHLTPYERYQVIYYIREAMMRDRNPAFVEVDDNYLATLPEGSNRGDQVELAERDYGPVLGSQLGRTVNNALTFRLPDEVSVCYDLHRMQIASVWQGGFLDLSETHHYRQRGERMPQIDGQPLPALSTWQWAMNGTFDLHPDAKPPRGPLRKELLNYHGHYLHGDRAILSYAIEGRDILESVDASKRNGRVVLTHTLHVGAGSNEMQLATGQLRPTGGPKGIWRRETATKNASSWEVFGPATSDSLAVVTGVPIDRDVPMPNANEALHVVLGEEAARLDLGTPRRTLLVRFRSDEGGTLV